MELSFACIAALYFLGLYLPASKYRTALFPVILSLYVYILLFKPPSQPLADYYTGNVATVLLIYASAYILITPDPHTTLHRRPNDKTPPHAPQTPKERFIWALDLFTNPRGINWSFEAPNLQRSHLPRWAFVGSELAWAAAIYVLKDAVYTHNRLNAAFHPAGPGISADGWAWRVWGTVAYWISWATSMALNFCLMRIALVASGGWEPVDCPYFFGRWADATSVRAFWGRVWHLSHRNAFTTHGRALAHALHFPRGSLLSAYTQLLVAFALSALIHIAGEWMLSHNYTSAASAGWFFIAQVAGIMLEDGVVALGKRWGLGDSTGVRALGMAWVLLWMAWSSPWWIDPTNKGRVMITQGPGISVIGGLWEGKWRGINVA